MRVKTSLATLALGALLGTISLSPAIAANDSNSFRGDRVAVASGKSFDQVTAAIKKLVSKNGMMVMAEVNQGKMLSMTGLQVKAHLFLVGNPMVGKKLFSQDRAVGLYVPLRVFVYQDADGKTYVSYDKPSTLLRQFHNKQVSMVGKMLDQKIEGLASMAAQ